ncbi:MAG TPA: PhzF family phenazine biosynthesis protein [bacterium]|nr:PhzF family phenazine biosynthesis protein [bacterium]
MSPDYRYVICDVFTETPLAGNALAVFRDAPGIPEERLQPIAREINFSETVFVYPPAAGGDARIRIFTPGRELPFAGHPILGSAIVLAAADGDGIRLETGRGVIPVRLERRAGRPPFGWMIQPLPAVIPFAAGDALLAAVGAARSAVPIEAYDNGVRHVFVALDGPDAVARLAPDMGRLAKEFAEYGVNCFAGAGARWKTRMFAPGHGMTEDPATGSAAGSLVVHLHRHGLVPSGEEIVISQGAEVRRPSALHARVTADGGRVERVEVGGSAVIVGRGEFTFD